ncbi:MAG TPA: DUF502 domain-containing protein [Geminicoccaceae bacterium]|nr:DUF502 domain-containing protein [Geminicoccaceae bacterium]
MWWRRRKQQPRAGDEAEPGGLAADLPGRISLAARLRAYFLTGVIVTAPIGITAFLVWQFVTFLDTQIGGLIPGRYNPESYLPFSVPGLGLLIMLAFLTLVGFLAAGLAGRTLVHIGERLLSRMPIVRSVYSTLKQIFETVLAQSSRSFREVVLIEYPRRGIGAIGFVTGSSRDETSASAEGEVVHVFLPTTPNPTSGFLLFVPREDLVQLDMTVEEGMKLVISGGIVGPRVELATLEALAKRRVPELIAEHVEARQAPHAVVEGDGGMAHEEQADAERRLAVR